MRDIATAPLLRCVLLVASMVVPARPHARPAPRLRAPIDDRTRVALASTRPPQASTLEEVGRLAGDLRLEGVTLTLAPSAEQASELQALLAAQQDPASPQYHRWLTPEAYAARFGVADADLAQLQAWLMRHGLEVREVSRARTRVRIAGTVAQLEETFGTELHLYAAGGAVHFAPAADVRVPAALLPLVQGVTGLSTFRPRSHLRLAPVDPPGPGPRYTRTNGDHFLTPGDVDVLYGVGPLRAQGLDGSGVTIDVVGQSAVALADVEAFQRAARLPVKDPVLPYGGAPLPGTGAAVHQAEDEAESDLDLEWTSAMAPGATVRFLYVGDDKTRSVWDAVQQAVDDDAAQIISVSYGICEPAISPSLQASLDQTLAQAAAQGQSVLAAAGDSGSGACSAIAGLPTAVQHGLAVDFPASSAYATAVGGTEIVESALGSDAFWAQASGDDLPVSVRSYMPEEAWNDGFHGGEPIAGGGGASVRTPRPPWQVGAPGLPPGGARLVPDVAIHASPHRAPYLFCSSAVHPGSCSVGFEDGSGARGDLTAGGGTSFGAPILAGMLAVAAQRLGGRQGVIAPALYRIAADPAAYAAGFHDVRDGGTQCSGSAACTGPIAASYGAGPGYDLATGLGSIDLGALLAAWPPRSPGFTAEASDVAVAAGGTVTSALTVVPADGWSGTVTWTVTSTPALGAGCLRVSDTAVAPGAAATTRVTVVASSAACSAAPAAALGATGGGRGSNRGALVGLSALGVVLPLRRTRRRWGAAALAVAAALSLEACGGGGSGGIEGRAEAGTYAVEVVGSDTTAPAITTRVTFTLTVN